LVGTAVGFVILFKNPDVSAWRWMYVSAGMISLAIGKHH
jgi:hypothetical protein